MRVLEHLGSGGAGDVYRAWDLDARRFVALKLARTSDPDEARSCLTREMRPLLTTRHPHLVKLLGAHFRVGGPYLVLELLDPTTLSARIAAGSIRPREAVRLVAEVATALGALHAAGWAHRDVKAENVLFGRGGRAVLTDLGLAQRGGAPAETTGRTPGTPSYMAPEIIRGEVDTPDGWRAADQYALGVTAYFALTGSLPFDERNVAATMFAHVVSEPAAPSARRAGLERVDGVVMRALAKDPGERFASVGDFGAALAGAMG